MQFLVMKIDPEILGGVAGGASNEQTIAAKDYIKTTHATEGSAHEGARIAATKNPGVPFGVFVAKRIYETGKPTFIEKIINEAGEMVLAK